MTSQGRHRPQARAAATLFRPAPISLRLQQAVVLAEEKGYEVRQARVWYGDHGRKATVVLYLSPRPVKDWRPVRRYSGQDVGATPRRNIENLVAYVEGLPDVRGQDVPGPVRDSAEGPRVDEAVGGGGAG